MTKKLSPEAKENLRARCYELLSQLDYETLKLLSKTLGSRTGVTILKTALEQVLGQRQVMQAFQVAVHSLAMSGARLIGRAAITGGYLATDAFRYLTKK